MDFVEVAVGVEVVVVTIAVVEVAIEVVGGGGVAEDCSPGERKKIYYY